MVIVLKSTTSNEKIEVVWSEDAVDFLVRHGALLEDLSSRFVFLVRDPYSVREQLYNAGIL